MLFLEGRTGQVYCIALFTSLHILSMGFISGAQGSQSMSSSACSDSHSWTTLEPWMEDNPENSINWKLTKTPLTFHCSINRYNLALILRVWPITDSVLLVFCFRVYIHHVMQVVIKMELKVQQGKQNKTSSNKLSGWSIHEVSGTLRYILHIIF